MPSKNSIKENFLFEFFQALFWKTVYYPKFLFLSLYRFFFKLFISTIGIYISVVILTLGLGFEKAVKKAYKDKFLGKLLISDMIIEKKEKKNRVFQPLNIFSFLRPTPSGLSYADYRKIKKIPGLKIRGILLPMRAPVTIRAHLFGRSLRSDVVLTGVSRSLIGKAIPKGFSFRQRKDIFPLILPKYILNAYNTFANINSLPSLNTKMLQKIQLDLSIGESSFKMISRSPEEIKNVQGMIIGVTELSKVNGLVIPLSSARKLNKEFFPDMKVIYSAIYLQAKHPSLVESLAEKIKKMGFEVTSQADISKEANKAVKGVRYLLYTMVGIMLIFTALAIFHGFVSIIDRKKNELLMFRIFGASKLWIITFLLSQVALMGFIYGKAGIITASELIDIGNKQLPYKLKNIGLYLEKIFIYPEEHSRYILLFAIFFSLIVSLIPAILAANQPMHKPPEEN